MKKNKRKRLHLVILFIGILVVLPFFLILQYSYDLEWRVRNFQSYNDGYETNIYEDIEVDLENLFEIPDSHLYFKTTLPTSDIDDIFIKGLFILLGFSIADTFLVITNYSKEETQRESASNKQLSSSISEITITFQERKVLDLVQEYLDDSRPLVLDDTLNYINSRISRGDLNINSVGARKILNSLESKGFISEGSTLTRSDILENENRRRIYNIIVDNPGIYSNQIVRELEISRYSVDWHITKLLEFKFIRKCNINNFEVYAEINTPRETVRIHHFIIKQKSGKILEFLYQKETGTSIYKLSKSLNMHYKTIEKYIKQFTESGIIEKIESTGNSCSYVLNVKYSNIIRDRLVSK